MGGGNSGTLHIFFLLIQLTLPGKPVTGKPGQRIAQDYDTGSTSVEGIWRELLQTQPAFPPSMEVRCAGTTSLARYGLFLNSSILAI